MTTLPAKIAMLKKARTAIGIECGDTWVDALAVIREQQARYDALLAVAEKMREELGEYRAMYSQETADAMDAFDALVKEGKDAK